MKIKHLRFSIILTLLGSVFINHPARTQEGDYRITANVGVPLQGFNNSRKVARTRDGKLWAVYSKVPAGETKHQIGIARSTDGINWIGSFISGGGISEGYTQENPSIAVDRRGNLHVVWTGRTSTYPDVPNIRYRTKPAGLAWQTPEFITTGNTYENKRPAIAVGSKNAPSVPDDIWVVWQKETASGEPLIYYSTRTVTTSWSTPATVCSYPGYSEYSPSIAVDDDNDPIVCWYGKLYEAAKDQIRYISTIPSGGAMGVTSNITGLSGQRHYDPCLALMPDGMTPIITWVGWDDEMPEGLAPNYPPNIHVAWGDPPSSNHARLSTYYWLANTPYQPTVSTTAPEASSGLELHVAWHSYTSTLEDQPYVISYSYTTYPPTGCSQPYHKHLSSLGDSYPITIWANWPEIGGKKNNRPKDGFPMVFIRKGTPTSHGLYYWLHWSWEWEDVPPATPPPVPTPQNTPITPPTPRPNRVYNGDYNGDGTSDLAVFRPTSGLWAIRQLTRIYFGSLTDEPVSGDYDGDRTAEIAIFRASSGLWAIRSLTRFYFGAAEDIPVPADYEGDNAAEATIFRPSTGLWAIRGSTRVYFGAFGDTPLPWNIGPGTPGYQTIFRPSTGLWAVRSRTRFYFGREGDLPLPGMYGDWIDTAAVFRQTSGSWVMRNHTSFYFGASGDYPLPAQYGSSGVSIEDPAIFRPSSGLWAVENITRVYFGESGDIPVTR